MKPMLPTLTLEFPKGKEWLYEVKYDGFRAILTIDSQIRLTSRNGKNLLPQFPEALKFFESFKEQLQPYTPLQLDGELTILINPMKSDFSKIQSRGRLRSKEKIVQLATEHPSHFLAFDLLILQGKKTLDVPFTKRKQLLLELCQAFTLPLVPNVGEQSFIQFIPATENGIELWEKVMLYDGEGIVAKQKKSIWEEGKRSITWLKYKNWKKVSCFIVAFKKSNGYFQVAVYDQGEILPIGLFKHGMNQNEYLALQKIIQQNKTKEDDRFIYIQPSICVELNYLQWLNGTLREPFFSRFLFDSNPKNCTLTLMQQSYYSLPIEVTHPEKILWPKKNITKLHYISYLRTIYPWIAPFLNNRPLTVIRYPHGITEEAFFQKNCPDYAPDFVETYEDNGIRYIVCNNLETFLWLGNQLAIEFHIPFHKIYENHPSEIVVDLDPPSKKEFPLAIEAALLAKKQIFDPLGLNSFVKTSGNRGLQIYLPIGEKVALTWEETRIFTEFVADYLIAKNELKFTKKRLKKDRGNRLYIDYLQHAEGKTIICPYSVRGNENAGVAVPLAWEELPELKEPDQFSMNDVLKRVQNSAFSRIFHVSNGEALKEIISILTKKVSKK